MKKYSCALALLLLGFALYGQEIEQQEENIKDILDSLFIEEVQDRPGLPPKVLHAEPLYIDLIRDLGARKGEREWNYAFGLKDKETYDEYEGLVEYEFAIIDRLGLEIELPFTFYYPSTKNGEAPRSRLNSLKLASQYTFMVSTKAKTSLAIGYLHEFELTDFRSYGKERLYSGNIFNPFFVAAKRWGQNFHTLVYTGPQVIRHYTDQPNYTLWQINTNFHYMIDGTRNFIGLEINKEIVGTKMATVLRPQMRVAVTDHLLIGIVTGVPVSSENARLSTFLRLIYEPPH